MTYRLIIILGNTHIRFGVFANPSPTPPASPVSPTPPIVELSITQRTSQGNLLPRQEILNNYHEKVLPLLKKHLPDTREVSSPLVAVMASVTPSRNPDLRKAITTSLKCKVILLTHDLLPTIPYTPPQGMGIDRLIKILALKKLYPLYPYKRVLILDFGTALTLDAVITHPPHIQETDSEETDLGINDRIDDRINYLGGMIIPGFSLSLNSIHRHTEQIPQFSPSPSPELLSRSTEGCITGGIFHFYSQALRGILKEVQTQFFLGKDYLLILTGGDAKYFKDDLLEFSKTPEKMVMIQALNLIAANLLSQEFIEPEILEADPKPRDSRAPIDL